MILLVDGNSMLWRAFHVGGGMSFQGQRTGAAYVFLKMLKTTVELTVPSKVLVCWDGGRPVFRVTVWPAYKQRSAEDPLLAELHSTDRVDFERQQLWLRGTLPLLGVNQTMARGWEADDLIAVSARAHSESPVVIWTGDRDLWQLTSDVHQIMTPDHERLTIVNFSEYAKGLKSPRQWLAFRVMTGDASDNIPGIGEVGEVRGKELAEMFSWSSPVALATEFRDLAGKRYGAGWTEKRYKPFVRNWTLMDLQFAVSEFHRLGRGSQLVIPARGDTVEALNQIEEQGMFSLVGNWHRWSEPFRRLT